MKTKVFLLFIIIFLFTSCTKHKVRKDLNTRYIDFEIVEIHPDVANVRKAYLDNSFIQMKIAETNLEIIRTLNDYESGEKYWTIKQYSLHCDSLFDRMEKMMVKFESSEFIKEACYYVKYRIPIGVNKIEKEEYYCFFGKDVYRRPKDWKTFMQELNYSETIDKALKYYSELFDLRHKASRM
jgi:hypothetical protein